MLADIGTALATVIQWCGSVLSAVVGESGALSALKDLWVVGISISALMLGIRVMRGFAWGN